MKKTALLSLLILASLSSYASATNKKSTDETQSQAPTEVVDKNCQAPAWAIAIGHEEKWKLHNGCTEPKDPLTKDSD